VGTKDDNWTPEETTYLFTLLQAYDLRFIVIADRYAYLAKPSTTGGRKRPTGRRTGRATEGEDDTEDSIPEIRRRSIEVHFPFFSFLRFPLIRFGMWDVGDKRSVLYDLSKVDTESPGKG
jgi:hypothetical protein